MTTQSLAITLMLLFSGTAMAQNSDHHKHHASPTSATKTSGKFIADKDLKIRMEKILTIMKTSKAKAAGVEVEKTVNDIFKTCKLAPDADAAIHPVLADILSGASLLKNGKEKAGHEKIHFALLKYEELFLHEGWDHKEPNRK